MRLREQMPDLAGATQWLNSKSVKTRDLIGRKPSLIHFWSVSCGTCKQTMPKVNDLRNDFKDELNVIAVHMPRTENDYDIDVVKKAAKEYNITQPIFIDNNHTLTEAFHTKYVPAYYVFDTGGRLRHSHASNGGMRMLRKRVNRVLGYTET